MKITREIIQSAKKYQTPFLLIDLQQVVKNYKEIKKNIDNAEVFYAVKANDHPEIIKTLVKEGSSFEISSLNEMQVLLSLGITSSKIMCLNPIKNPEFLKEMYKARVTIMAYDSKDEIDKIARYAPNSEVILRINVSNEGSDWPLTKKFGIDAGEAIPLLQYSRKKKLKPVGLTFHVGSQCLNKNNWVTALYVCDDIWNQAKKLGIHLYLISLGGGIPIKHIKEIPSIKEIGEVINNTLKRNFKTDNNNLRITIEPGRGIIGDAGTLITTVVGKAKRGKEDWVYVDAGVFNGIMETIQGFMYELKAEKNGKKKTVTIAGPSCDSIDIPFKNVQLSDVNIGERVYILNAGAYTTVYASRFNGFDKPGTYFV